MVWNFLGFRSTGWSKLLSSDYNFVRNGSECVPVGLERVLPGICTGGPDQTYQGSSGWRKIPGNTCVGGVQRDTTVEKKCSQGTSDRFVIDNF
jgi:hypothetical protein